MDLLRRSSLHVRGSKVESKRSQVEGRAGFSRCIATDANPQSPKFSGEFQGLCETTLTERFTNPNCCCPTYSNNLGPCKSYEQGGNGRCVYCDHEEVCHFECNSC